MNGRKKRFDRILLHDITASTSPERAWRVKKFLVHGEDEHSARRTARLDILEQLQAVVPSQAKFRNDQIRVECFDSLDRGGIFLGDSADAQILLVVDQRGKPTDDEWMVIDQDN